MYHFRFFSTQANIQRQDEVSACISLLQMKKRMASMRLCIMASGYSLFPFVYMGIVKAVNTAIHNTDPVWNSWIDVRGIWGGTTMLDPMSENISADYQALLTQSDPYNTWWIGFSSTDQGLNQISSKTMGASWVVSCGPVDIKIPLGMAAHLWSMWRDPQTENRLISKLYLGDDELNQIKRVFQKAGLSISDWNQVHVDEVLEKLEGIKAKAPEITPGLCGSVARCNRSY